MQSADRLELVCPRAARTNAPISASRANSVPRRPAPQRKAGIVMTEEQQGHWGVTCDRCGKAIDPDEASGFGLLPGEYCEECAPVLGGADCDRLRGYVEAIIGDCERNRCYANIWPAIRFLEEEFGVKGPALPRDDPRLRMVRGMNTPEAKERLMKQLRDAGLGEMIVP